MLNLERLRTFSVAAQHLNFTRAGELLHLSQPAVSQHMRELEIELDVILFERRGRRLALTPAGERLKPLATALLQQVEQTAQSLGEFRAIPQGILQIGADTTTGVYVLPHAVGHFSRQFPGVRCSIQVNDPDALWQALQEGSLDFALVCQTPPPGRLHGWHQFAALADEIVLIVAPGHPWAAQPSISIEDLPQGQLILRQRSSSTRQLISAGLSQAGFDPDRLPVRFEMSHTEGIKQAVMAGLGAGFASRFAVTRELVAGWLVEVPIRQVSLNRHLWMIQRPGERTTLLEQQFAQMLLHETWLPSAMQAVS